MKQTAVEWLLDNLISEPYSEEDFEHNKECWIKAEEMEKQQQDDFAIGFAEWCSDYEPGYINKFTLEIYKKECKL